MKVVLKSVLAALALTASLAGAVLAQGADRATVLILDASGSMWGQVDGGRTRIEIARDVLGGFLGSRDMSVPLGVVAYGHNRKGDCSDIEVIAPVGGQSAAELSRRLSRISPKGKTPLGQSLRIAAREIPRTAEEADIVLVTDGLETCEVDPCAVAEELASEGIRIRAHVVGFGLTEAEANALACVPERTGGLLMRPQSGAELAEALSRATAEAPPPAMAGVRFIFSYPGAMPESYEWALRDDATGKELVLGTVSGDARYLPFTVELAPGSYTAIVTARAGRGEAKFTATGKAQDIVVTLQGLLPVTAMRDRGPYAARGEAVVIDLNIAQAGQETGGAALALRLYPADGGEAITYSTIEGEAGAKNAGINLPTEPGQYLLRLETWGGEVVEELIITAEHNPAVTLIAPPKVEPGGTITVESMGSQLSSDGIEIWQGDRQVDWGLTLGDLAYGNALHAPAEPGVYDLVYKGYDASGERVEKARVRIEVGAVADDATGQHLPQKKAEADQKTATEFADAGEGGGEGEDVAYSCDGPAPCEIRDAATGLSFLLPVGWWTDYPSTEPYTAGAQSAGEKLPPHVNFFRRGTDDSLVLGPHQWLDMNGPCEDVSTLGQFCMFQSNDPWVLAAYQLVKATLKWGPPQTAGQMPTQVQGNQADFAASVQQGLAGQDPQTKAMIGALLGAAQNAGPNGEIDQKAIMGALLGAMQGAASGAAGNCDDGQGHGPDNCENGKEAGKTWTDYPHRCLPGDKTVESCDMRDTATNLAFYLPENWVADVTPAKPFPRVEFAENAGSAHSIWLNPADWALGERGCEITRVGRLCTDPDRGDEKLASVFRTLQFTLTTGRVLRRCGDQPCTFGFKGSPISGQLPARWSVEFGETLPDGRVRTWFWDLGRGGNFKLMGLNQPGGKNCEQLQPGDEICEFTSNIPQEESGLIINMIVPPAPQDRKPALQASPPRTLAPDEMKALLDLIGRN